ncbi:MAG: hypothetical protein ACK5LX_05210 [Oscillospiraceae bacterium]
MSNVVFFNSYKLKKGSSIPDFLDAVEKLNNEYISKQKGYISFQILVDGETWADSTTFETMEDAKRFAEPGEPNEYAEKFYSFLNFSTCKSNFYTVEKTYK